MEVYFVVKCSHCGRYLIFVPRGGKRYNLSKKCPYCGHTTRLLLKTRPSWERIIKVFYNFEEAREFVKKMNEKLTKKKGEIVRYVIKE